MIDGVAVQQKGCLRDNEEGSATCATPPSSAHVVKCCQGHLCNMNVTVQAPGKGDFVHIVHISLGCCSWGTLCCLALCKFHFGADVLYHDLFIAKLYLLLVFLNTIKSNRYLYSDAGIG